MSKYWLVVLTLMLLTTLNAHAALSSHYGGSEIMTLDAESAQFAMDPYTQKLTAPKNVKMVGLPCAFDTMNFGLKKVNGVSKFTELVIEKRAESNVSKLSLACMLGGVYKTVNFYSIDMNYNLKSMITLQNVTVKSVEFIGNPGEDTARITFTFEKAVFEAAGEKPITIEPK